MRLLTGLRGTPANTQAILVDWLAREAGYTGIAFRSRWAATTDLSVPARSLIQRWINRIGSQGGSAHSRSGQCRFGLCRRVRINTRPLAHLPQLKFSNNPALSN